MTNMDYYEFMERANTQVTEDEYNMIETVYLAHPETLDVGQMVAWFKKYGMKGVKAAYLVSADLLNREEDARIAHKKIEQLEKENAEMARQLAAKERTIRYLLGKLDTATILGDISKEALADLIANQGAQA